MRKEAVLCTIGLATMLVLSGLMSAYEIVPKSVDAHDVEHPFSSEALGQW